MKIRHFDVEIEAMKLGLEYQFVKIAMETTMMYVESKDKRKEVWDRVVWLQYFNMNVDNFKKSKANPGMMGDRLREIVENSFEPLDLNRVDEKSRATLIQFTCGEEVKLYHLYALQSASEIYFDFKKKYNDMLIVDFIIQHFGIVIRLVDKGTSITPN
jgi:hypothetical protein